MTTPSIVIRTDRLRLLLDHLYVHDIKTVLESLENHVLNGTDPDKAEMSSEAFILYTVISHDMDDAKTSKEALENESKSNLD